MALPRADVPAALFFFNAGVELGQLAVLAPILPQLETYLAARTAEEALHALGTFRVLCALRETDEEAGARIELLELYTVLDVVRAGQIHLFYRARMLDTTLAPGPETLEARLFHEHEIPWDQIAFRTVRRTLEHFFEDRRSGRFALHEGEIS